MAARLPDFLIIGAMKAGTSSLHEQLRRRAGLFLSDPKEPNFFSDDRQFARGREWYESLFAGSRPDQLCGESSTHYTKLPTHPRTLERMKAALSRPKLIYVMRDPIERIVSQYIHEWSQREVRGSLERAVRSHERYVAYSSYARQLAPFLDAYGPENVLPVAFELLVARPDAEFARICRFLGDPTPDPPTWDAGVGSRNVSRERMRRSALREGILRLPAAAALKSRLPRGLREALKSPWRMERRPAVDVRLREELAAAIDPDLKELSSWLGRSLSCAAWRDAVVGGPLEWAGS